MWASSALLPLDPHWIIVLWELCQYFEDNCSSSNFMVILGVYFIGPGEGGVFRSIMDGYWYKNLEFCGGLNLNH